MKRTERHHLKENELASTLRRLRETLDTRSKELIIALGVLLVVALGLTGYLLWQDRGNARASALLAEAMAITEARVVPPAPAPPAQTSPTPATPPAPTPGSYPSEQAKLEAAVPKFLAAAHAYPATASGIAARYHAAATLVTLGRVPDAIREYNEVIARAGDSIYGQMARLGIAEAQMRAGQYDPAIATFRELSSQKDGQMPVDAVLMQLGRAYLLAGKTAEARQTFSRIVEEFPDSPYSSEAKQELETLKSRTA